MTPPCAGEPSGLCCGLAIATQRGKGNLAAFCLTAGPASARSRVLQLLVLGSSDMSWAVHPQLLNSQALNCTGGLARPLLANAIINLCVSTHVDKHMLCLGRRHFPLVLFLCATLLNAAFSGCSGVISSSKQPGL